MAFEQHEPAIGRQESREHGCPGIEVMEPDQGPAAGVEQVGAAVEVVRRIEDIGLDPRGGGTDRIGEPSGELEHPRTEVDPDDLVRTQVPERERVAPAGALEVDRPMTASVQVADELELGGQEVRPARTDQGHCLVEPALVPLGGLIPGGPVRAVHAGDIGALRG